MNNFCSLPIYNIGVAAKIVPATQQKKLKRRIDLTVKRVSDIILELQTAEEKRKITKHAILSMFEQEEDVLFVGALKEKALYSLDKYVGRHKACDFNSLITRHLICMGLRVNKLTAF